MTKRVLAPGIAAVTDEGEPRMLAGVPDPYGSDAA